MKSISMSVSVFLALLLSAGCASEPTEADGPSEVGELTLTLATTSALGVEYHLRAAIFEIRGPQDEDVSSEDHPPDQEMIDVSLQSGDYLVTLAGNWYIEHSANGQPFTPIPAELASPNPVAATVLVNQGTPITFQFQVDEGMINFGRGTLSIGVDVEEVSGSGGASGGDPQWRTAQRIESNDSGDATGPRVAMDAQGRAVVVWVQDDGTISNVWANRFTPINGWGNQEAIENLNITAVAAQVAMDAQGNAMAALQMNDGTRASVFATRFTPSDGWDSTPYFLAADASNADVAMNPQGDATAVWEEHDGTRYDIWANRFAPTGGWGVAETLEDYLFDARVPQVAMNAQGNAVAIWTLIDSTGFAAFANQYTPATGWGNSPDVVADDALASQVAMDPQGNAIAVWEHDDGTLTNIWSARFTPTGGWGAAEPIQGYLIDALNPQIAMDAQGNALAVWQLWDGTNSSVFASRYTVSGGWDSTPDFLASNARAVQVAMDPQGNAVAVWTQDDRTYRDVWSSRFTLSVGWGIAEMLDVRDDGHATSVQVAMDPQGNATAVWAQHDGTRYDIWANQYR